jgi:hypothetical protein
MSPRARSRQDHLKALPALMSASPSVPASRLASLEGVRVEIVLGEKHEP